MKFRPLEESEIEVKVKQVTEKGALLLLYKTARTDMDLLDEAVGPEFWTNDYKEIDGVLYCGIGVQFQRGDSPIREWVWKWDCGVESNVEKEKGQASDAFKRAGFRWGIGRELYTAPFIFVPAEKVNIQNHGGKWKTYDTFSVEKIAYENGAISGLAIRNDKTGKRCFVWQST